MKETLIGNSELNNSLFLWFNLSTQIVVALKCEIWKLKFMKMELEDKSTETHLNKSLKWKRKWEFWNVASQIHI